jgi:hypothetical protein
MAFAAMVMDFGHHHLVFMGEQDSSFQLRIDWHSSAGHE